MILKRVGTFENLPSGATYDLFLIAMPDGFPESQLKFHIEDTPRKITGLQKTAQIFLKVLMTSAGSDVLNPGIGTEFNDLTHNANIISGDVTLYNQLTEAVRDAESQTKQLTADNDPASTLEEIQVLGLDVNQESAIMYLQMTTGAGDLAAVAVPFPEIDLKFSA